MTQVAIVYHSGYGHTARQADAVADGARSVPGTAVQLVSVADAERHWHDLEQADAIVFGAPTYMGSLSAPFKAFMDASSKAWMGQKWKDKLAAGFTNSGSQSGDKLQSLVQLVLFAGQHGMHWVNLGLMPGNNASTASPEDLNRLGGFIGAMAQSNVDAAPEVAPPPTDLRTAAHLGRRVAEVARQLAHGRQARAA